MRAIPLQPLPSQTVQVVLGNQTCQVTVYQLTSGLYTDLLSDGKTIVLGVLGRNIVRIVRDAYLGFAGDLLYYDNQGADDPVYFGLGSRFSLIYIEQADLR